LGALNSLSQLPHKATMPGVRDFYQGTEYWDLSLVDPDNRRPVDFAGRAIALSQLSTTPDWAALAAAWPDGRIKLALTARLIALRNALPSLFRDGAYHAIEVSGPHRDHVVAFARTRGKEAVIVAVGRLFAPFTDGGRRWPIADWQATLSLRGFTAIYDAFAARTIAPDEVPVTAAPDQVPVAAAPDEIP